MRRELEPAVVEFGQNVAGEEITLSGMGVPRENEGTHAGCFEFSNLAKHLIGGINKKPLALDLAYFGVIERSGTSLAACAQTGEDRCTSSSPRQ